MKPAPFRYHDPHTIEETLGLLSTLENAKILAGGQSLMPMLNMRFVQPDHIIDLGKLDGISSIKIEGDTLHVGAMCRQRNLEFSDDVARRCPVMREALLQVGHRQTRNRGTIGGSLCHLDPAAELVAIAATHDAKVTVKGSNGDREIDFADFPVDFMTPSIGLDELVTEIRFPLWAADHGYAFIEVARRHGDFAIVSATALLQKNSDGTIARAALTLGGVAAGPVRMAEAEQMLMGKSPSEALFAEAAATCGSVEALDDVHVSAAYRQRLAKALSRRALAKAWNRALGERN